MGCASSSSIHDSQSFKKPYCPRVKFDSKKIRKSTLDLKRNDYEDGYGEVKFGKSRFAIHSDHHHEDNRTADHTHAGYESD